MGALSLRAGPEALAEPRGEHFNETIEFTETGVDNPCTPEFDDIILHIKDRVQGFVSMEIGTTTFDVHISGHANGVAADGTQYEGKLNVKEWGSESGDGVSVEFETIHRFISHGSAPNFIVKEAGLFTAPPPDITLNHERAMRVG